MVARAWDQVLEDHGEVKGYSDGISWRRIGIRCWKMTRAMIKCYDRAARGWH